MPDKASRRKFLKTTAATAAVLGTAGPAVPAAGTALPARALDGPSIYTRKLGIKPVINGVGVVTSLGGTIMPPEVVEAMVEASRFFVPLVELQEKVGATGRQSSGRASGHGVLRRGVGDHVRDCRLRGRRGRGEGPSTA